MPRFLPLNIGNQEPEVSIGQLAEVVIKVIGKT